MLFYANTGIDIKPEHSGICIAVLFPVTSPLNFKLQAAAYGSAEGSLTVEMMEECVREMISQHQQKSYWQEVLVPQDT